MKQKATELIETYSSELSRLCTSLCNCRQDAEDLFQITWEKVLRNLKKYDESRPFDKWLFRICINAHKDMMKNPFRKKRTSFKSEEDQELFLSSICEKDEMRDEYISLHKAIGNLDTNSRQVITLYYFRDFTTRELSELLGVPEGTVKSRLFKAREEIRKEMQYE